MKDLSQVADWWWESTLREAKCYYDQWRGSTPLQRIQIRPRLPEDLAERKFQRTEQRGVQMLLKAIPSAEQQELVTDRALSSTAILYKLMVRFQPGGAGEKQILLKQLTSMPKASNIQEVAAAIRNWRRHFGRAEEVQAVLPDRWTNKQPSDCLRAGCSYNWMNVQIIAVFGPSVSVSWLRLKR